MSLDDGLKLSSSAKKLKDAFFNLKTPQDVAHLLQIKYTTLIYYLYILDDSAKYNNFDIPKKTGGLRTISSPLRSLKIIQQKLNQVLQVVYVPKNSAYGFIKDKGIVPNAKKHIRKRFVLNLDIEDFFGSINFGRVRGMFLSHPYNLSEPVATVLAQICCFENKLPQGAPTSPIISNMICAKMDDQLRKLAEKNRSEYTRYADDITFSTTLRYFPRAIVLLNESGEFIAGEQLETIINSNGFDINQKKFRLKDKRSRQEVTGITVNEFPNAKRILMRQIRAMLHNWDKYGLKKAQDDFWKKYDNRTRLSLKKRVKFKSALRGKIEFIGMVRGKTDPLYIQFLRKLKKIDPSSVTRPIDELDKLCEEFKSLKKVKDKKKRGYAFEKLLDSIFQINKIPIVESFRRNGNGEQIDGAFKLGDWHYLVECRWRKKLSSPAETDAFDGKIGRSGKQTMGFFISINGWSKTVPPLLKQNIHKQIVLMDGKDLEAILNGTVKLQPLLEAKIAYLNQHSEPFLELKKYLGKIG